MHHYTYKTDCMKNAERNREYYAENRMNNNHLIPVAISTEMKLTEPSQLREQESAKQVRRLEMGQDHYDVGLICHIFPP